MEWYTPLTIMPAIGLIILSTANFLVSLNEEIYELEKDSSSNEWIIQQKFIQLKRLGWANAMLYSSALFFMFSSLSMAFFQNSTLFKLLMVLAAVFFTIALVILFTHSFKAISIRHKNIPL